MINMGRPLMGEEEAAAISEVVKSGQLIQGKRVKEFERQFAEYTGAGHAVAVNSGTAGLHLSLLANGIGKGDEVIVPGFSFIATSNAVLYTGARPVFADIEKGSFNIDVEAVSKALTPSTKAVIAVHLFGQPADINELRGICREKGIAFIEDSCQALGAEYGGKKAGTFGTGVFSFYASKNITTCEGGMVTTDSKELSEKLRVLANGGAEKRYYHTVLGYNYRMTEISGALGTIQLSKLDKWNKRRVENASLLSERLGRLGGITTPTVKEGRSHVFSQYTIMCGSRDALKQGLYSRGVDSAVHYPTPLHMQPVNSSFKASLPVAENACRNVLSLPVHPSLESKDIEYVAEKVKESL